MELVDGYSRMVQAGPFLFCGGTTSVQPDGSMIAEGDSHGQVEYVLKKLIGIIEQAGGAKEDVYSVKIYATPEFEEKGLEAFTEIFGEVRPILQVITIHKLTRPTQLVEIEMNAITGCAEGVEWEGHYLKKELYCDKPEAEAVGASTMVKIGPFVFCGGAFGRCAAGILKRQVDRLASIDIPAEDVVKVKRYATEQGKEKMEMRRFADYLPTKSMVFSDIIVDKLQKEAELNVELFAIEGSGKNRKIKGSEEKYFADYVCVEPFLFGGMKHSLDAAGEVVGAGDSEIQESYVVKKFTEEMKEFGFAPEEMVKFKGYYTEDFGALYGETETPYYEEVYKPVKPLYTGVYVSRVGKEEEIFEMEMMAIRGAIEKS